MYCAYFILFEVVGIEMMGLYYCVIYFNDKYIVVEENLTFHHFSGYHNDLMVGDYIQAMIIILNNGMYTYAE